MNKAFLTLNLISIIFAAQAQIDTTFYTSVGGKSRQHTPSELAYYELNNGYNRNGLVKQYFLNHSLYAEVQYSENYSVGEYKRYYKSGQVKEQKAEINEEDQHLITRWYRNGQKRSETKHTHTKGERINRRAESGGIVKTRLISAWDSLGNKQVIDGSGHFNAPDFDEPDYWEKGEYIRGKKTGRWSGTKSGQIDYEEEYDQNGELITGVSYNEDGSTNEYNILEQEVSFPGGYKKWARFLQKNFKYPKVARKAKVEGSVIVTFVVDKFGLVSDVQVVTGIGSGCDEEAIRVLERSKQWTPTIKRGKSISSQMLLRVEFRLR